jgi:membrane-associated phospholipid phosphatase
VSRPAVTLWKLAALGALLAAACAVTIDLPLARWIAQWEPWPIWDRGIAALEYAGGIEPWPWTALVVLATGAAACFARPAWRAAAPAWLYIGATSLLVRNLTMWLKLFTGRLRPTEWLAHGGGRMWLVHGGYSFPSGHVILFAGLVVPLAVVAPRVGRPLLAVVAFVMLARVAVGAHFASDVIGALALSCACAALWEPVRRLRFTLRAAPLPGADRAARAARSPA